MNNLARLTRGLYVLEREQKALDELSELLHSPQTRQLLDVLRESNAEMMGELNRTKGFEEQKRKRLYELQKAKLRSPGFFSGR